MGKRLFGPLTVWLAIYPAAFFLMCSAKLLEGVERATFSRKAFSVDSRGCPLALSVLNYDPHCFGSNIGTATATFYYSTMPLCCVQVMTGLGKLMLMYANSTGKLFLEDAEGEACLGEMLQDETLGRCAPEASRFMAFKSPCTNFTTRTALAARLNMVMNVTYANINDMNDNNLVDENDGIEDGAASLPAFAHLVQTCGPFSSQQSSANCSSCSVSFESSVSVLSASLHDALDVCAAALFVSLASTNVDDPVWTNSLFACAAEDLDIHLQRPAASGYHKITWAIVIIGIIIGSLAIVTITASVVHWRKQKRKSFLYKDHKNPMTLELEGSMDISASFACSVGLYTFSLEEIVKATNHFNNENLLGQGEAGKVFKGVLPSGQLVAVKQIAKDNKPHTFKTELVSLSKVRHAHLVTLMGFCQSNDAYYLVYEYCSNGDLGKWLFVSNEHAQILSWEQRVRIAVNTARGLWFLHNYPGGSIVHRDIKPTNILLNEHLEAKLSDFGLARHMETDNSHVMTEVKGTTGYLDPEYMSIGELTQASDVYSFGIVLLQLISARRAIDLHPATARHRLSLLKTARLIAETGEGLLEFVDPHLQGFYSVAGVLKVFEVALSCIASCRINRLNMQEVLQNLEHACELSVYAPTHHPALEWDECETTTTPCSVRTFSLDSV
ncbi:hypothetical protein GOP47_0028907 [Adiantum capillus-veneris]|nr:hypothetical protein GOP47_0028907 [Adiantum capillus-veneris]